MRSEGYSTWVCVSVCLSVCPLSHISPTERLFVLKTLSRTQRATKIKKVVGICLKRLRSRVMPRNMSEKANMLIIPTYRCQLSPLDTQQRARGYPTIVNNIQPCPKLCLLMPLARDGTRTARRGQLPRTRIGIVRRTRARHAVCAEGLHFSAFQVVYRYAVNLLRFTVGRSNNQRWRSGHSHQRVHLALVAPLTRKRCARQTSRDTTFVRR